MSLRIVVRKRAPSYAISTRAIDVEGTHRARDGAKSASAAEITTQLQRPISLRILSVTFALWLVAVEAAAARAVVHVEGANAAALSAEIRDALPAGTTVEAGKPFDTALVKDGGGPLARAFASGKGIGAASERIERALAQSGGDVAVVAQASRVQRGHRS